jgi:hypothetical protein
MTNVSAGLFRSTAGYRVLRQSARVLSALVASSTAIVSVGVTSAHAGSYTIAANGPQVCALGRFVSNTTGFYGNCDNGFVEVAEPTTGSAYNDRELWEIDSPSSALTITGTNFTALETGSGVNSGSPGYGGGAYWNGGGEPLNTGEQDEEFGFGSGTESATAPFLSQYFGLQVVCSDSDNCDGSGTQADASVVSMGTVSVNVQETQGPSLVASGSGNLLYQTADWVWNPPSDPWPAQTSASDPSGVCGMSVNVNGAAVDQPSAMPNSTTWQQCPSPFTDPAVVDTSTFVPTSGQLTLSDSASNAAGVVSSGTATINVDNVQPSVSITPLNDANPGGWAVNHSVTLRIAPTVGPSGISGVSCSDTLAGVTSALALTPDPSVTGGDDVTIDGNGSHAVSCNVSNNAINPQGANNTGSASETVDIDEQPPGLSFEPMDPTNPTQVVVQTADDESAVAGGTIQITAQGSSTPAVLPTSFNSAGQLIATIPDASLKAGAYTVQASATSQVGNTGVTSETVTLPLRIPTTDAVSFAKIKDPLVAKKVKERVRVGGHYVTKKRHGKKVRVKVGGHFKTITVIKRVEHCTTRRVKVAKHKWKLKTTCAKPTKHYQRKLKVGFGKTTTVYGELTTNQDLPVANQTVKIDATPANGSGRYRTITSVKTNAEGGWSAKVPAGPSRKIRALYGGAADMLPATDSVKLTVPARIAVSIRPRRLRWSGYLTIKGHLKGGYVPKDGVALRLLVRYPGSKAASPLLAFRTDRKGDFSIRWTFNSGRGTLKLPFWVATDSDESDYPYVSSGSRHIGVTFTNG